MTGTAHRGRAAAIVCMVTPGPAAVSGTTPVAARVASLDAQVQHAIDAGVDIVQVREPDLAARALAEVVIRAVHCSRGTATRIVVNDRADVAVAAGAHGVHLGARSLPPSRVRTIAPAGFLVGCSVHSVLEARAMASSGAVDYLIAGTVFASASKPEAPALLGIDGLAAVAAASGVPVLAIGGINPDRVSDIAATGAAGFAAIGLFWRPGAELRAIVEAARRAFDSKRAIP